MKRGGIVLCGGRSSRMGMAKAWLPFGPEPMLARVVRLLGEAVGPIVVVAAPEQELPELPASVEIVRDRREGRGPLEGLAAGLAAISGKADAVYATSCDVPLLAPAFVERMFELLGDDGHEDDRNDAFEIAVPKEDKFHHPLAAVYRPRVLSVIEALLSADQLRPVFLFDRMKTREVPIEELRDVDSQLDTLANLNRPEDYFAALERAGFAAPLDVVAKLNGEAASGAADM